MSVFVVVCGCMYIHVWSGMHIHAEYRRGPSVPYSSMLHLLPFRQDLSLYLELSMSASPGWIAHPQASSSLPASCQVLRLQALQSHPAFHTGAGDPNPHPRACPARALSPWAISPVPRFMFLSWDGFTSNSSLLEGGGLAFLHPQDNNNKWMCAVENKIASWAFFVLCPDSPQFPSVILWLFVQCPKCLANTKSPCWI